MLDGVEGIRFCRFEDVDVGRHALVQRIVQAYDSHTRAEQVPMGMEGEGEMSNLPSSDSGARRPLVKPQ